MPDKQIVDPDPDCDVCQYAAKNPKAACNKHGIFAPRREREPAPRRELAPQREQEKCPGYNGQSLDCKGTKSPLPGSKWCAGCTVSRYQSYNLPTVIDTIVEATARESADATVRECIEAVTEEITGIFIGDGEPTMKQIAEYATGAILRRFGLKSADDDLLCLFDEA